MADTPGSIIALDVGSVRIGVAIANSIARLARPLTTLDTEAFDGMFRGIVDEHQPLKIIVGLPRSLSGNDTPQTEFVRQFTAAHLAEQKTVFMDEALTSQKAEAELKRRKKPYDKPDIDALAATYILQDYLDTAKIGSA